MAYEFKVYCANDGHRFDTLEEAELHDIEEGFDGIEELIKFWACDGEELSFEYILYNHVHEVYKVEFMSRRAIDAFTSISHIQKCEDDGIDDEIGTYIWDDDEMKWMKGENTL